MFVDNIENFERYVSVHPKLKAAFIALSKLDADTPDGSIDLGDGMKINVCTYNGKDEDECVFEEHHVYADVHMTLSGVDTFDSASSDSLEPIGEFNETDDYILFSAVKKNEPKIFNRVSLTPRNFAFVFPREAHRSLISTDGKNSVIRKAIAKIPFEG